VLVGALAYVSEGYVDADVAGVLAGAGLFLLAKATTATINAMIATTATPPPISNGALPFEVVGGGGAGRGGGGGGGGGVMRGGGGGGGPVGLEWTTGVGGASGATLTSVAVAVFWLCWAISIALPRT
jgi:hypothetical protein